MIRKVKGGWRVVSHKKGRKGKRRNLGTFRTKAEAQRRLEQVRRFKHIRGK
jgi:hypothetical protein